MEAYKPENTILAYLYITEYCFYSRRISQIMEQVRQTENGLLKAGSGFKTFCLSTVLLSPFRKIHKLVLNSILTMTEKCNSC